AVFRLAGVVQRIGHILGAESLAVVELDALAQRDIERQIIGPTIALGEERLIGARDRIVVYQRVADEMGKDDDLAKVLVIEIGGVDLVAGRPDERIIA